NNFSKVLQAYVSNFYLEKKNLLRMIVSNGLFHCWLGPGKDIMKVGSSGRETSSSYQGQDKESGEEYVKKITPRDCGQPPSFT
ncbi:hypothetical protein ACQP3C_29295, partial [Escherichia coli]